MIARTERTVTALAWAAFFPLTVIGALVLWQLLGQSVVGSNHFWIGAGLVMLSGAASVFAILVCSMMYQLYAVAGLVAAGVYGGLAMVGLAVGEAVLVLGGLWLVLTVQERLRKRWGLYPFGGSQECRDERNPRCRTCHASKVCPLQPGGMADQYKHVVVNGPKAVSAARTDEVEA